MKTQCISTSHMLARELSSKEDGFIIATDGEKEYIITDFYKVATHANLDDRITYWALNLRECGKGNIKK